MNCCDAEKQLQSVTDRRICNSLPSLPATNSTGLAHTLFLAAEPLQMLLAMSLKHD